VALTFIEETHQYFDDGVELPSVTEIIRFCNYDSRSLAGTDPFYRNKGSAIHAFCQEIDYTGEMPTGTGYDGYLKAYSDFLRDYRIKGWLHVEQAFGNAEIGYAGTIDRIGYIDGILSILDIKTGSAINKTALQAQLTGYSRLFLNEIPFKFPLICLYGLHLKSTGKYQLIKTVPDNPLFDSCLYLHSVLKGMKK